MNNRTTNPVHHHCTSLSGTSLQIPQTQRSQSTNSSQRSFDQPKSRASTRHSHLSSGTASSNWTSVSAISANSSMTNPSLFPTSGYPKTNTIPGNGQMYPGSGYPVSSHLQHSYGYPSSNFPCCEIPEAADLQQQLLYPSSEFPGGGVFPGELEQDDGSQPFIGAYMNPESGVYPSDPMALAVGLDGANFPGGTDQASYPTVDMISGLTSFDPRYNLGYPT